MTKQFINGSYIPETNTIMFWYREAGEKKKEYVKNFFPYFYVKEQDFLSEQYDQIMRFQELKAANKVGIFIKLTMKTVPDLVRLRDLLTQKGIATYEADIPFVRRYMIDTQFKINPELLPYKKIFIDIETDDTNPEIIIGRERIVSIGCYSTLTNEYIFIYDKDEKIMLQKLLQLFRTHDFVIAYNGELFDFPYLVERIKRHKLEFNWHEVQLIDIYKLLYYSHQQKFTSYTLDNVGEKLLGLKKIPRTKKIIELTIEELKEYNLRDVEIMYKLEQKLELIRLKEIISNYCGCFIADICPQQNQSRNSVVVENTVMRKIRELNKNIILPTKPKILAKDNLVAGKVFDPIPGVHENVFVIDFTSLYNRIIQTANISPETYDVNGEIEIPIAEDDKNVFTGVYRYKKEKGILPFIMGELEELRNNYKKQRDSALFGSEEYKKYDQLQASTKTLLLSFYGVIASKYSRLYKKEMAESITGMARFLIKVTRDMLQNQDWIVCSGDTDSVFIKRENSTKEDVEGIVKYLNSRYDALLREKCDIKDSKIKIKFEKIFKKIIFIGWTNADGTEVNTKKRYIGLMSWKEGKETNQITYTGIEMVRSDTTELARSLQKMICEMILLRNSKPFEIVYELEEIKKKLYAGEINKKELVLHQRITKSIKEYEGLNKNGGRKGVPMHIRAAKHLETKGEKIYIGMKIPYIVTNFNRKIVLPEAEAADYDADFYWQQRICPSLLRILKSAFPGYNFEEKLLQNPKIQEMKF